MERSSLLGTRYISYKTQCYRAKPPCIAYLIVDSEEQNGFTFTSTRCSRLGWIDSSSKTWGLRAVFTYPTYLVMNSRNVEGKILCNTLMPDRTNSESRTLLPHLSLLPSPNTEIDREKQPRHRPGSLLYKLMQAHHIGSTSDSSVGMPWRRSFLTVHTAGNMRLDQWGGRLVIYWFWGWCWWKSNANQARVRATCRFCWTLKGIWLEKKKRMWHVLES